MRECSINLTKYVSNLDRNIYAIYNLPEEVIAVIFAYVSRSSASFRENLSKLLMDEELDVSMKNINMATTYSEKAARFHEKWVVGYGHSSVAEHSVAHIGIEKISRLASAELELANSFNSFTEYSQRYQSIKSGDIYIPQELTEVPDLKKEYISINSKAHTLYEKLMEKLKIYLLKIIPPLNQETKRSYHLRIEKLAFEDARYVLTLATLTNLGMTGNGRALRDTLVQLLSSSYKESVNLARSMEQEICKVIPTLLKYVNPSPYLLQTKKCIQTIWTTPSPQNNLSKGPHAQFTFIHEYEQALTLLIIQLFISQASLSFEEATHQATSMSIQEKEAVMESILSPLRFFDNPLEELHHLTYQMEMKISEANWHQLLRHNRGTRFSFSKPSIQFGYTVPPRIKEAELNELYESFLLQIETVYQKIFDWNPEIAHYTVTNAHHRQITATASLWELYHLINLRTSPEAQWDIKETFTQLHQELSHKHPILAKFAQRRI